MNVWRNGGVTSVVVGVTIEKWRFLSHFGQCPSCGRGGPTRNAITAFVNGLCSCIQTQASPWTNEIQEEEEEEGEKNNQRNQLCHQRRVLLLLLLLLFLLFALPINNKPTTVPYFHRKSNPAILKDPPSVRSTSKWVDLMKLDEIWNQCKNVAGVFPGTK